MLGQLGQLRPYVSRQALLLRHSIGNISHHTSPSRAPCPASKRMLGRRAFAGEPLSDDQPADKPSTSSHRPGRGNSSSRSEAQWSLPATKSQQPQAGSSKMESVPLLGPSRSLTRTSEPGNNGDSPSGDRNWQYLVALCTLSVVICYADRSNISTAVLPMAEQFGWDKAYQGVVLSVFFGGYATTQILGGGLADRYGGKLVLASGVALWSLFTFLTPAAAASSTFGLLLARVMLGVGEGVAFPSIHSLISRNVPADKQTTAVGIVTAASYAGTALAFGVSPLIISQLGWEYVFYLFSGMAVLWLPLWLPVKTNPVPVPVLQPPSPSAKALTASSDLEASTSGSESGSVRGTLNTLGALLRRKEVMAICLCQYAQSWGMYGLLNWLPTFFSDYYKIELSDLGSYTLLPYLVQGGLGAASGVLADRLLKAGWNKRRVRTLLQVVGMVGPAACLLLAVSPAVGASASMASKLITVGLGFSALTLGGVSASHLDIAPRNAGLVFGAGNTAATLAGLISVPVTGFVLQSTQSWSIVFTITAIHYVLGAAIYAAWIGDEQLPEDMETVPASAPSGQ